MAKKKAPKAAGAAGAGKGKLKLIILVVIALLLVAGISVGATWFLLSRDQPAEGGQDEGPAAEAAPPVRAAAVYEMLVPAFVVNFPHQGRQRYMQVSVALMTRDPARFDVLKAHLPLVRNRLVMLFSSQDFATLATPEGQEKLRQEATASVQELAQQETGGAVVERVLFTNFVLQ